LALILESFDRADWRGADGLVVRRIAALGPAFSTNYLARPWAMLLDCAKPPAPTP
jgi:hypothetical protein